jgi:hypothetical protein
MDKLTKNSNNKIQLEKQIVTELYNDFINDHAIMNHEILKKDMVCDTLQYNSHHIDLFGYVGNEYEFGVRLTSLTTKIYIGFNKSNNARGSGSTLSIQVNDSRVYVKIEYDDDLEEWYEYWIDESDNEYVTETVLEYERRIIIMNKIKDDDSMTNFVKEFLIKLKSTIDTMVKLNDRKY